MVYTEGMPRKQAITDFAILIFLGGEGQGGGEFITQCHAADSNLGYFGTCLPPKEARWGGSRSVEGWGYTGKLSFVTFVHHLPIDKHHGR